MARLIIGFNKQNERDASAKASWNTPHPEPRHGMTYGGRMALAFALTSLLTVGILGGVVTVVWGGAFSDYTRANVELIAQVAAENLAEGYDEKGAWTKEAILAVTESSTISDDIGMQVTDADGRIMYDDTWPAASMATWLEKKPSKDEPADVSAGQEGEEATEGNTADDGVSAGEAGAQNGTASDDEATEASAEGEGNTSSASALTNQPEGSAPSGGTSHDLSHSPVSTAPTDSESAVNLPIVSQDGSTVGQIRLWVLGSDALLTKADTAFRERTFNAVSLAAVVAVVASIAVGFVVSTMFTHPVRTITDTARRIREGDLSARTNMRGDDEIEQLGETFDEMAASLESDLKRERRLTSDVAHELRTPLMAMQATVEAMQDGVYPTDYEHLETIASETRRLARLVQQTLDLSRLENHTAPLRLDQVDMLQLTQTIVNNQHQLFHNKDIHLRFVDEIQGRPAIITCDSDMITQCIINLMSNAMRYTPEGGWVAVSVFGDRKHVMVSVSDTGIGIAKEDLARIFGRFWRADASRAREAGGLGVGLAVTKQIVERHQGFIAVESELEKGTTFTIHLPRRLEVDDPSSVVTY